MKEFLKVFTLCAILCGAIYGYVNYLPHAPSTVAAESKPAAEVRGIPKVQLEMKVAPKVYASPAKVRLSLPPAVIADANEQVISATTTRSSEHPTTVTTVIDASTGESKTYVREDPLPWVAIENRGEVRIDYGFKVYYGQQPSRQVTRLSIREDVIAIKGFHAGLSASLDTDKTTFVGVGIGYRW